MHIGANHRYLQYSGRVDWTNPEEALWVFPATSVKIRFTGNILKIRVRNKNAYWENSLGVILDGFQTKIALPEAGEAVLSIPVGDKDRREHEALFFKRQDACHEVAILCFELGDGESILNPGPPPERRMEVYGDSVSAGEVSEAVRWAGKEDPPHNGEYSNSWYSYAWMTARRLDARIHVVAQGGIALLDGTGWFCEPHALGMASVWNKIQYHPQFGRATEWDFSRYTPDVVLVALGQNDNHPRDYMKDDYESKKAAAWRKGYRRFLENLREVYPNAYIVCMTTLLNHDESWDRAIGQVVSELADGRISQYLFKRNGRGTPGHLRISEAAEMAEELSQYIEGLKIENWSMKTDR